MGNSAPHHTVNALLDVLGKYRPILPKDARTLLGTARSNDLAIQEKAGGQYYYFGVLQSISHVYCLLMGCPFYIKLGLVHHRPLRGAAKLT